MDSIVPEPLPLTNAQRVERFGRFRFEPAPRPSNPEAIRILDGWAEANIAVVFCPQLERLFGLDAVRLHRKVLQPFLDLWAAWEAADLLDGRVTSWNGGQVARYKRGRAGGGEAALSNHSWGSAFDICARDYPLGVAAASDAPIRALVPDAERLGWFWAGRFRGRPDPMHFEHVGIVPPVNAREAAQQLIHERLLRFEVCTAQALLGLKADGLLGPKTIARARAVLGGS